MYFVVLFASVSTQLYCLRYLDFKILQRKKNRKLCISHHVWDQFCSGHRAGVKCSYLRYQIGNVSACAPSVHVQRAKSRT